MRAITWQKTGAYLLVVLPVLGLGGIAAIAQQQQDTSQQTSGQESTGDSLADAARKVRERKKTEQKPKKVYTTDDLGGPVSASAATPPAESSSAKTEAKEGGDAQAGADKTPAASGGADDKNSETAWRKRFREARDKLAQAEQELDILQREAQKAQVQFYNDPQKALSEQYTRKDVTEKDTKIEAKKQEIAQMKQHIADMEDELRRSGGDSGWAR
jgi:hypothetical protein